MAAKSYRKGSKRSGNGARNGTGNGRMTNAEINQMITDRMVAALEAGTVPWRKPWSTKGGGLPRRMSNGQRYRGVNIWTLALTAMDQGYSSPWWGTYHHIINMGGQVRAGQKSTKVVWWKRVIKPDPDNPEGEPRIFLIGSTDSVFNADQADWQEGSKYAPKPEEEPGEVEEMPDAEALATGYLETAGPALRHLYQDRAYYQSGPDMITLPERSQFSSQAEYYSTEFHELGHSTGHPKRLNREGIAEFDHFGSGRYGREELVAEMTAAMLSARSGIDVTFDNSASYLGSWITAVKGDIKMISKAAAFAQAAVDMITGEEDSKVNPEEAGTAAPEMAIAA